MNGNLRGNSANVKPVPGTHGVILLQNVRRVTVRNITVRQSNAFALHLGNVREFVVDGVTLDRHRRDGVHVNGPASEGTIRNVSGDSHDDPVALNAWEWRGYAPSFGAIHHITIERIIGAPDEKRGTDSIRLLSGVKRFTDGATLDCPIHDIVLRDITDIRVFNLLAQPNLEAPVGADASAGIGTVRNLRFEKLTFHRPGSIQLHANTDGLIIDDVKLNFPLPPDYHLITFGPRSVTYKGKSDDPATWRELYAPDLDCTLRNFHLHNVTHLGQPVLDAETRFLQILQPTLNPDYPKTTPRGGTGKASLVR